MFYNGLNEILSDYNALSESCKNLIFSNAESFYETRDFYGLEELNKCLNRIMKSFSNSIKLDILIRDMVNDADKTLGNKYKRELYLDLYQDIEDEIKCLQILTYQDQRCININRQVIEFLKGIKVFHFRVYFEEFL
jgi:hypothetical protein